MFLDILEFKVECKKNICKKVLVKWSQTYGKMALIVCKVTLKKLVCKIRTFMGKILAVTHFVTHFTHVSRQFEFLSRKQNKLFRENCFENVVS